MRKITLIISSLLVACGGQSGLSQDEVQAIPDGTATGSALTGDYDIELRVVECRGSCGPFAVGIFTASVCDVGDTESTRATVTQTDGHLRIVTDELPSLLEGGTNADGSFDVGGYATQFGGNLEITARSAGTIEPDGTFRAMIDSRSWGQVEDQGADCYGVREAIGTRED